MNHGVHYGAVISTDKEYIIHYFSEIKGQKKSDLYLSKKVSENHYSKPVKISLSTSSDEFSPFLSSDGKTLYFASDRKGTLGQADIWKTTRLDDTWNNWSEPINIGAPVNTKGFDAYFSVEDSWKNAYTTRSYVSRDGGSLDILHFVLRPSIRIKGKMTDKKTCLLYTSPSPRDGLLSRMPSSA